MGHNIKLEKIREKKWLLALLVTAVTFLMLAVFWNQSYFTSDEEEIFVKGQSIAQGLLLYGEIGSQHMPLMYYLAAFFSLLGVDTITGFRLCFYLLIAVLWGLMFIRYSPRFGKGALVCYPVLYILSFSDIELGFSILSEQFQGIGMAILFFELLTFQQTKSLKIGNCCMISLAIFLSFGSAFVSIFGIFAVGLTVLFMELRVCRKEKLGVGKGLLYLIKGYWKLILIVALPFAILLGYFAVTHTLYEFYGWAYLINREIYPKYLGSYGSSVLQSMLNGIGTLGSSLGFSALTSSGLLRLALLLLAVMSLVHIQRSRRDVILTGGVVFFLITCATRGVFDFHGLPVVAVLCALGSVYLPELIGIVRRRCGESTPRQGVALICALILCSSYLAKVPNLFLLEVSSDIKEDSTAWYLDQLTQDGERVGMSTLDYDQLIQAGVIPASVTGGSCPWMWEWGGEQAMGELTEQPPRVFLFNSGYATWGFPLVDYAQDLAAFIDENYTSLASFEQPTLYLRNDVYLEGVQTLDPSVLFCSGVSAPGAPVLAGDELTQTFSVEDDCALASFGIMVGTYERSNDCTLEITLTDETTGRSTLLGTVDCRTLTDNAVNPVGISAQALTGGHSYTVTITSPDAAEGNAVTLYHSGSGATEDCFSTLNGERQDYNLCLDIHKG